LINGNLVIKLFENNPGKAGGGSLLSEAEITAIYRFSAAVGFS
jgi:hypothetical protein